MTKILYLPRWAKAQEAADWLASETGQDWPLSRLLESPVEMAVEISCRDDESEYSLEHIFVGRRESFIAKISSAPDRAWLTFGRETGKLTIFERPDGRTIKVTPPIQFTIEDLRFPREGLRLLAHAIARGLTFDDARRLRIKIGGMTLTEAGSGMEPWIEMNGGTAAIPGCKIEILNFHEAPSRAPTPRPAADKVWTASAIAETTEQRQARRYRLCVDAGLTMPDSPYRPLPRGIGRIAENEGIARQTFAEDVKAHIGRLHGR